MNRYSLRVALLVFGLLNYIVTNYALTDVLGNLAVFGVRWAAILSVAFCAIDLIAFARTDNHNPAGFWYLIGAWILAAAMNATLTWWGLSIMFSLESRISAPAACAAWVVRILLVGANLGALDDHKPLPWRRFSRRSLSR